VIAGLALAAFITWVVIENSRERKRQRNLAATRPPLNVDQFTSEFASEGIDEAVAKFVWDEFQPYYFSPLTPNPADRPIGDFRIDGDDLSDMVTKFEKQFGRRWRGKWIGPDDPTLAEFGRALLDSTSEA